MIAPIARILANAAFMKLRWVFVTPYAIGIVNKAHDHCGAIWLVRKLTLRSVSVMGIFRQLARGF
jgi:hypothetical protein